MVRDNTKIAKIFIDDFNFAEALALIAILEGCAEDLAASFNEMSEYLEKTTLKGEVALHLEACQKVADMQKCIHANYFADINISEVKKLTVSHRTSDAGLVL